MQNKNYDLRFVMEGNSFGYHLNRVELRVQARKEKLVIAIQLLMGHSCHHLSQSSGITIEPTQAPNNVSKTMKRAERSCFCCLGAVYRSRMCKWLVPQNHRHGREHWMLSKQLNIDVSVTIENIGAPKMIAPI